MKERGGEGQRHPCEGKGRGGGKGILVKERGGQRHPCEGRGGGAKASL